jgi:DNA-binding transcriptional regulator YiaG
MSQCRHPTTEQIKALRAQAGITQEMAATILHTTRRAYQQWEAGDRKMHPAFWELFLIKNGN